jgi:hypothetical protein
MINILTDINRTDTAERRESGSRRRLARRVAKARAAGTGDAVRSTAPAPPGGLVPRF